MKGSFIAAGGVLLAAAAMATTMVGTAVADDDKRDDRASLCVLDASQDATWIRIDHHSVTAGTRDAEACKGRVVFKDDKDDKGKDDDKDDDRRHHPRANWQQPGWWGLDGLDG